MVLDLKIFIFHEILHLEKFECVDLKYNNIFFKFRPKKIQIKHFWSQSSGFLVLHETLHYDKFETADFKYDGRFLNLLPVTPKYDSFGPNFKDF